MSNITELTTKDTLLTWMTFINNINANLIETMTTYATKEELTLVEEALTSYATKKEVEEALPNIVYMD